MLSNTTLRTYNFYEDSIRTGCLYATYERSIGKTKLSELRDQDRKVVALIHLVINGIPALYLKGFKSSVLPEVDDSAYFRKQGSDYLLDFEGNWDWYSKARVVKKLTVQVRCGMDFSFTVLSICKIMWLKRLLEEEMGASTGDPYLLFLNHAPLEDHAAVEDLGLQENELIEAANQSDLTPSPSALQMATGGSYLSVKDFERYADRMREKINIVCQICIPSSLEESIYGTGFLIGHFLLITNQHVVSAGLQGAKAKFFFHSEREGMEIAIHKDVVCDSPSPGKEKLSINKLDFAILRLIPSVEMTGEEVEKLCVLNSLAEDFFKNAFSRFNNKKNTIDEDILLRVRQEEAWLKRANIIQHPLLQTKDTDMLLPQPKQIAFRDNRVYTFTNLLLHYQSETKPGSSGSPVINDLGELIGIHYSECTLIREKLCKHIISLCRKFNYDLIKEESDLKANCFTRQEKRLYFHLGKNEGSCSYDERRGKKITIREFITEECEEVRTGKVPLGKFILHFLHEQGEKFNESQLYSNPEILRENSKVINASHLYCNTAINIESIFRNLQECAGEKQVKVESAGADAEREWALFLKSRRSFLKKYRWHLLIGVVGFGIAIAVYLKRPGTRLSRDD